MKGILYAAFLTLFSFNLFAASFTPGNLVVVRVGTGSSSPSNKSTQVFLDEYTTSGNLVQSIALPTTPSGSNHALTLSGKASTEGDLTLSPDNQYLTLVGFDTTTGYANVSTGVTNRTVARIGADGTVNTSTGFYSGSAYVSDNFRSGVTLDGTGFWCSGDGTGTSGGTWYLPFGSFTSSPVQVNSGIQDTRVVNIFGGQLYFSATSSLTPIPGVFSVGTGTPVTAGQSATILPGISGADSVPSPYTFYFVHETSNVSGLNVLYVADGETAAPLGGVYKFSLVNGNWVSNGNIPNLNGLTGLTVSVGCKGANIYTSAPNGIFTLIDTSGYNQTITGSFKQTAYVQFNANFRGIAFAPGSTPSAPLTANFSAVKEVSCYGAANGAITLNSTGGTAPFSYNWGGGVTTQNRINLGPGTYTVTVTDTTGCTATHDTTITQPVALTATLVTTPDSCFSGNSGSISLSASQGTAPYSYSWTGGINTQNRTGLATGNYSVTVTDSHSCTFITGAQITQPAAITVADSVTNLPCTGGGSSGAIKLSVSGGTPGYSYNWSNTATSANINNLTAGPYMVTVTDTNGCTSTVTANVSQSGSLIVTPVITAVRCYGQSNGSINIQTSGGTPGYSYGWSNSIAAQSDSNLSAGPYALTVTDQGGCTLISNFNVPQPTALVLVPNVSNITCYGLGNGSIRLIATGGTAAYRYYWSNNATSDSLTELGPGTYISTVTDNNGCIVIASDTVIQPDSLSLSLTVTNATGSGEADGSINLNATGGTGSYGYDWSNSTADADAIDLVAGNYCVTVTDLNSCTVSDCAMVGEPNGINEIGLLENFIAYDAGGSLHIWASLNKEVNYTIEVYDITGKVIFCTPTNLSSQIQLQIPDSKISSGCYLVRIATTEAVVSKKIMVVR